MADPKGRGRKKGDTGHGAIRGPARDKRAAIVVDARLRGVSVKDIGQALGFTDPYNSVREDIEYAQRRGILDTITNQLKDSLAKTPGVFNEIFDTTADEITERGITKALDLKLKAAKILGEGLGPLTKRSVQLKRTETLSLDDLYRLRAARKGQVLDDTVDAEVVESERTESGEDSHVRELRDGRDE